MLAQPVDDVLAFVEGLAVDEQARHLLLATSIRRLRLASSSTMSRYTTSARCWSRRNPMTRRQYGQVSFLYNSSTALPFAALFAPDYMASNQPGQTADAPRIHDALQCWEQAATSRTRRQQAWAQANVGHGTRATPSWRNTTTMNGAGKTTTTGSSSRCSASRARASAFHGRPSCTNAPGIARPSTGSTSMPAPR